MRYSRNKEWRGTDVRIDFADMDVPTRESVNDETFMTLAVGVALPELASAEDIQLEEREYLDLEAREKLYNPSDLQDVGDPEGTDVGLPFGLAAGGEMGEGGRDYNEKESDPWGSPLAA